MRCCSYVNSHYSETKARAGEEPALFKCLPPGDHKSLFWMYSCFRTKENTEIVVAKYENLSAAAGSEQAKKIRKKLKRVNYVLVEYDPQADDILRFEGAKDAEDKIKSAIQQSKNGVLVIS